VRTPVPARRLDAPTAAASDTDDVGDWPRICNVTMRGIFSADLSGKVVKVKDKLFIIAGVADKLLVVSDDGGMEYPAEKVILAMVLGNIATVRSKLALKSKIVSGTLHGRQVTGRRFERQPHLGDVNRLVAWGGCDGFSGPPGFEKELAFFQETEDEDNYDGWADFSPMEFKCLELVDWKLGALDDV
jgi:hypothetical protein